MRPSFFHHLHPPTIPAQQARLRYTLGAGGLAVFLILILFVTGILLMFYYIPTPGEAGLSIQTLTFLVPYGGFLRNLHYWAAQLLVVVSLLHLGRVIFTGAYAPPRRLNYLIGLGLLVLILFLDYTGYILRWDEGIRWALVTGTNLLRTIPGLGLGLYRLVVGGDQLGTAALIRFYAWHLFGLTLFLVTLGVWHLFRVRRDGGIAVAPGPIRTETARITRHELVRREIMAALLGSIVLILLATFWPAPLAPPMEEIGGQIADSRAPWFFLWIQGLLQLGDPFLLGVLIPGLILTLLGAIPYLPPRIRPQDLGSWFPKRGRPVQIFTALLGVGMIVFSLRGLSPP